MTTKNQTTTVSTTTTASTKKRVGARKAPSTAAAPSTAPAAPPGTAEQATQGDDLTSIVGDVMSFLDVVEPKLGPSPAATTSTQKRRVAKPRKGADKLLPMIASIVQQHGLDSASLSSTTVMDAYNTAQMLVPLQTRLQKMSKRVGDKAFAAQTDAWAMGLQLYSMLKRRAKTDGQVAQHIAPLAHVFSYRHPLVKAEKPTKRETQVKAEVKHVTALAHKHGVPIGPMAPLEVTVAGAGSSEGHAPAASQAPVLSAAPAAVVVAPVAPVAVVSPAPAAAVGAAPVAVTGPATATGQGAGAVGTSPALPSGQGGAGANGAGTTTVPGH